MKWLISLLILGLLVLALPTVKNLYLYANYYHGARGLERVSGVDGELAGVWAGTFDTYTCGMDERHDLRLVIENDGRGTLTEVYKYERIFDTSPSLYSWSSMLPFATKSRRIDQRHVEVIGSELIVHPLVDESYRDTFHLPFRIEGDSILVAFGGLDQAGGEPAWGMPESDQLVEPRDLVDWWGR